MKWVSRQEVAPCLVYFCGDHDKERASEAYEEIAKEIGRFDCTLPIDEHPKIGISIDPADGRVVLATKNGTIKPNNDVCIVVRLGSVHLAPSLEFIEEFIPYESVSS